jgi:hypothetical protein
MNSQASQTSAEDFAWKVHDNLSEWTARVDVKASIALATEAAVLGFVITLATDGKPLGGIKNWPVWLLQAGTVLLLLSVILAIFVVLPQLRSRHTKQESMKNRIYFGHLRHWEPEPLAKSLAEDDDREADELALQLVTMSKIVWRKHVWLQWSLFALLAGVVMIGLVYTLVLTGTATR